MNINNIVKSVKDKYDNTTFNPFPKDLNITVIVDYETSISNLLKALGKIKQEDLDNIAKLGKLVESSMKKSLK